MTTRTERLSRPGLAVAVVLLLTAGGPTRAAGQDAPGRIAAGGRESFATLSHACAVVYGGLQCWGAADLDQTGDGSGARRRPLPVRVPGLLDVRQVAAGGRHTCVIERERLQCFGDGDAARVEDLPGPVTAVAAGLAHGCAIAAGRVLCWGRNTHGQVGAPPAGDCGAPVPGSDCRAGPSEVAGIGAPPAALALGDRHGCALAGSRVWCWGDNARGALGDGSRESRPRAAAVALPGPVSTLAAGADHACALVAGEVFCWGADRTRPAHVAGLPAGLRHLAAGGGRSCAATGEDAWCWLASGGAPEPVRGLGAPLRALAVSPDHACALRGEEVWCWGENDAGQLGRGTHVTGDPRAAPVAPWDTGVWRDANGDARITLVCIGDSRTRAVADEPPSWCDRLGPLLGGSVDVVNRGLRGATATPSPRDAEAPVRHAIESDRPDLAVVWLGADDVRVGRPTVEIVAAIERHVRALRSAGVEVWIALVPPPPAGDEGTVGAVDALNGALRAAFPPERTLDFASGLPETDRDGLGPAAHAQLARRAADAVLRLKPGNGP